MTDTNIDIHSDLIGSVTLAVVERFDIDRHLSSFDGDQGIILVIEDALKGAGGWADDGYDGDDEIPDDLRAVVILNGETLGLPLWLAVAAERVLLAAEDAR